jgi:hypothetical protein
MAQDAVTLIKNDHRLMERHFEPAVDDLVAAVAHHVREEESELLPALRDATDERTLERLGAAFERVRLDELATSGYEAAPAATEIGELAEATRDELYEKAREADIPGRSRMKKDDLIEALREQR